MAFNKRAWKGRQGVGLNKFSINGATPVTVVNQPDSITEVGDALSAGNLNDLEDRIDNAFVDEATARDDADTDLKNALDATNKRLENLEQEHGSYQEVTAKSPYTIPSGKAKNWSVNVLRGVTRAKNQLGTLFTTEETWTSSVPEQLFSFFPHKYLCFFQYKFNTLNQSFRFRFNASEWTINDTISASDLNWHTYAKIADETHTLTSRIQFRDPTFDSSSIQLYQFNVVDLTLYFGAGNEPTLAEIQTYYPWLLEPSDYGTSLVDSVYEGVRSKGVNIWDEEWEIGNYGSSGEKITGSSLISKNMIPVKPSTAYYFYEGFSPAYHNVYYYDANGTYVSKNTTGVTAFTTPSNCYFMNFALAAGYGTSYRNDITIAKGSTAVTYHAYMESTLSLPTPITLRSAGSVAEEFYLETGEKTNPLGERTLDGNETFDYGNWDAGSISLYVVTDKLSKNYGGIVSAIWADMQTVSANGRLYIRFKNATSRWASLDAFKADAIGTKVCYELATPDAPTQFDPIQNPYLPTESGGTISSILTDAVDDSMTLGYINL